MIIYRTLRYDAIEHGRRVVCDWRVAYLDAPTPAHWSRWSVVIVELTWGERGERLAVLDWGISVPLAELKLQEDKR